MEQKMVTLKINDISVTVPEGTVLEAARNAGIKIPPSASSGVNEIGACRICVVEVKGAKSLVASCVYPVSYGMEGPDQHRAGAPSRQLTLGSSCPTTAWTASPAPGTPTVNCGSWPPSWASTLSYANDELRPRIEDSAPNRSGRSSASCAAVAPPCGRKYQKWGSWS